MSTPPFDTKDIQTAYRWDLFFCGQCPHGHLVFFDEHNKPLLHAVMSARQMRLVATQIENNDPNFRSIE